MSCCAVKAHLNAAFEKVDGSHAVEADLVALLGNLVMESMEVSRDSYHGRERRKDCNVADSREGGQRTLPESSKSRSRIHRSAKAYHPSAALAGF
jgi:hypothetical protein